VDDPAFVPSFVHVPRLEPDSIFRLGNTVHVPYWRAADEVDMWNIACQCEEDANTLLAQLRAILRDATIHATKEETLTWLQSSALAGLEPGEALSDSGD
jgi:hypothetical protein